MTPEDHNRFLGLAHLGFSAFYLFLAVVFGFFFWLMMNSGPGGPGDAGPPPVVFFFFIGFILFMYGAMTAPSMIAGYALLKRKRWARTASIIAGVTAAMQFPIGTAVCAYTFWFFFSDPGKVLYENQAAALPPAPPTWANTSNQERQSEYLPRNPPDWR